MSSVGKPLKVAANGTSLSVSTLGVDQLTAGTTGQSLFMNGSTPTWTSNKWSWSLTRFTLQSTGSNINTLGYTNMPIDTMDMDFYGSTGAGGLTSSPFTLASSTAITVNRTGYYRIWPWGNMSNDNATAGGSASVNVVVNNIPIDDLGYCSTLSANGASAYSFGGVVVQLTQGQTMKFQSKGNAAAGNVKNSGIRIYVQLVNFTA